MQLVNPKKIKLGNLLIASGRITEQQLQNAIKIQKEEGGKIGDVLIRLGLLDESGLAFALCEQLKLPFIDLKQYTIKREIILKLPERLARRFRVILLNIDQASYLVGMTDPTDIIAYDELTRVLGAGISIAVVLESDLLPIFDLVYRRTDDIVSFAKELKEEIGKIPVHTNATNDDLSDNAPVAKLLDSIFMDAVQMRASDVHIEPDENGLRIRQRIDGVLHESLVHGKEIVSALVLRIKLIANLNISEKRLPQDGRFKMMIKNQPIDVRVSTMPVHFGESVVMRILDQSKGILEIAQLGMPTHIRKGIEDLIHQPNGVLLVTGPTGSGKTTTLYAALSELNSTEKKIITIEDPVEYTLPRANQVQVNPAINLNFATVLRASLRQDPDIIMIGEMRDEETVKIGLRAAMTGHFVLSSLHTNDSVSSAIRLMDMGAEGFLVAGSLRGILAQRLLRVICDTCVENYTPSKLENEWIQDFTKGQKYAYQFKYGKGCSRCNQSGYLGRTGIYELLTITPELANALRKNDSEHFKSLAAVDPNFVSLAQSAFTIAASGMTSLAEVFRVIGAAT